MIGCNQGMALARALIAKRSSESRLVRDTGNPWSGREWMSGELGVDAAGLRAVSGAWWAGSRRPGRRAVVADPRLWSWWQACALSDLSHTRHVRVREV